MYAEESINRVTYQKKMLSHNIIQVTEQKVPGHKLCTNWVNSGFS